MPELWTQALDVETAPASLKCLIKFPFSGATFCGFS